MAAGVNTRNWRTFGHPGAVRLLSRSAREGRLAHAYLFTGPDRVGKRTLAIDLACVLNGEPAPDLFGGAGEIDLESCPQARRIRKGLHADVRLIGIDTPTTRDARADSDALPPARRRQGISIDHVHDLQREAVLKPFEGKSRVFVITGAHRMSIEASNSLLKTLEEPAENVYIVLTSPSIKLLPETVVSRCQQIELRPVASEVIQEALMTRYGVDDQKAATLARLARGRPGWAIDALADATLIDTHHQESLRIMTAVTGRIEERFRYARKLSSQFWRDRDSVLGELERWLEWLRDTAILHHGLSEYVADGEWLEPMRQIADALSPPEIAASIDAVLRARNALEANALPQLALDVMMTDIAHVDRARVPAIQTA